MYMQMLQFTEMLLHCIAGFHYIVGVHIIGLLNWTSPPQPSPMHDGSCWHMLSATGGSSDIKTSQLRAIWYIYSYLFTFIYIVSICFVLIFLLSVFLFLFLLTVIPGPPPFSLTVHLLEYIHLFKYMHSCMHSFLAYIHACVRSYSSYVLRYVHTHSLTYTHTYLRMYIPTYLHKYAHKYVSIVLGYDQGIWTLEN